MMKFRILVVVISLLFHLGEVSSGDDTPVGENNTTEDSNGTSSENNVTNSSSENATLSGGDVTIWEEFKNIDLNETSHNDCNSSGTKIALEWLQQKTSTTDKDGKPIEEVVQAKRWTDLAKLRKFLASKNFTSNPGSLQFFNWQDKKVNIDCGKTGKWSVVVPQGFQKYAELIAKHSDQRTLSLEATHPQIYFRIFKCESKECSHYIYGINRPFPEMDFPLFWMEKASNAKIGCMAHPCIQKNVQGDICKFAFNPEPNRENEPYKFSWTIPAEASYARQTNHKDRVLYNSEDKSIPLDVKISPDTPYESHLEIPTIERKHEGLYECVIQDANGVVSTFAPDSFPAHETYKGTGKVHVRGMTSLYVALGCCVGLLVLTVLMNYLLPSSAQFDDESGSKEKKEN